MNDYTTFRVFTPMTNPKENKEIDEELSTEELRSVSGSVWSDGPLISAFKGNGPEGTGFRLTLGDHNKKIGLDTGTINKKEVSPIFREQ